MGRRLLIQGFLVSVLAVALVVWRTVPVKAIPPSQAQCAFDFQSLLSDAGQTAIPGLSVGVTPSQDGAALVRFSADVGVDDTAELRIAYSVDGVPAAEYQYGPVPGGRDRNDVVDLAPRDIRVSAAQDSLASFHSERGGPLAGGNQPRTGNGMG